MRSNTVIFEPAFDENLKELGTMEAYRTDVIVDEDGNVVINKPPFRKGEKLEAILLQQTEETTRVKKYPLRGEPVRYVSPFDGVDEDQWRALN